MLLFFKVLELNCVLLLLLKPPIEDILANMHCHTLVSVSRFMQYKISWWFCFGVVGVSFCYLVLPL